ncbi:MAG: YgiT-type zinc finger protein [Deltaproteobacteria bacterium]|nr:YgiT-type zinc finger protein [Deltaproteobacteria bacterium]
MTMLKITTCPSCGSRKVKKVRRSWTGSFKGKRYTVPNLQYHECPDCGEKVYDRDAMREIEAYSPAFERMHPRRKSA